jgi:dihydrofolate reductase
MGKVYAGMNLSLDGFINDRNGGVGPLYPDLEAMHEQTLLKEAMQSVGAVVMGRRAFEMGEPDSYVDNYEFQTPIFVLTHHAPEQAPKQSDQLTFTFVSNGVASAIAQAKAAAGDKDVIIIGGASTIQQCLNAGLVEELQLGFVPVLLGGGLRLFDHIDTNRIKLEISRVLPYADHTDLVYRVTQTS